MKRKNNGRFFRPQRRGGTKNRKENKKRVEIDDNINISNNEIEDKRIVGLYVKSNNFGFVVPDSRKIHADIYISKKNDLKAKNNQKVIVEITKKQAGGKKPEGKIIEVIGNVDQAGIDMLGLIREYEIPNEFPGEVITELENIPEKIEEGDIKNRVDLRNKEIFTIDGEDAKDLDDAVSVEKNDDGTYTLHVHIADVSNYVTDSTSLNKEAINRGTSIYMLDRVIPMLPPKLSNGICSLNENEDRFTLSITMNIDDKGKVLSSKIYKAVIRVTKRISYNEIYNILTNDDIGNKTPYFAHFKLMKELAEILENRRKRDGYLDLDIPESKITLDENGKAVDISKYEITFANKIIEQFMLTANEEVAKTFYNLKAPFIYRTHEVPDLDKVDELNNFLYNLGYKIEKTKKDIIEPKEFQKVLEKIKGKQEGKVIQVLVLRTLRLAKYEDENKGHFGIASKFYCHFTSPIRRYPDLFIHRVISKYIESGYNLDEKTIKKLKKQAFKYALSSSETEKRAVTIERQVDGIKKAEYMENKIGEEFEGVVSSVTSFGIFIELENTVEGFLRFENLGNDYYVYDEDRKQIVGNHTKEIIKIGDSMKVKLIEANKLQRRISFEKK